MNNTPLTQEEKIDAIYSMLKKQERNNRNRLILKLLFWTLMILYSFYVTFYLLPTLLKSYIPSLPNLQTGTFES